MKLEHFKEGVDILVKAFHEGKLMHGDCRACAVGNLLGRTSDWANFFVTSWELPDKRGIWIRRKPVQQFSTGIKKLSKYFFDGDRRFSNRELAAIEFAFESVPLKNGNLVNENTHERQLAGLYAVVDVMADMVEESILPELIAESKKRFTDSPVLAKP